MQFTTIKVCNKTNLKNYTAYYLHAQVLLSFQNTVGTVKAQ